jgi:hypothetical protein
VLSGVVMVLSGVVMVLTGVVVGAVRSGRGAVRSGHVVLESCCLGRRSGGSHEECCHEKWLPFPLLRISTSSVAMGYKVGFCWHRRCCRMYTPSWWLHFQLS